MLSLEVESETSQDTEGYCFLRIGVGGELRHSYDLYSDGIHSDGDSKYDGVDMKAEEFKDKRVVYVPNHALPDTSHKDAERGKVSSVNDTFVFVKFDKQVNLLGWDNTVAQACNPRNLYLESFVDDPDPEIARYRNWSRDSFTCFRCCDNETCPNAWDPYCTDGDCLDK